MKISNPKIIFKDGIIVEKSTIIRKKKSFPRYRVLRQDAAAILLHNKREKTIIMVKQFRYAIHDKTKENILEIPAGKIDKGESPEKTIIRETMEECGYKIKKKNIQLIAEFFAAPGYTTEKFFVYYGEIKKEDKIEKGGGLEAENEYIEVIDIPVKTFLKMTKKGLFEDAKTLVAAQWFLNSHKKLV